MQVELIDLEAHIEWIFRGENKSINSHGDSKLKYFDHHKHRDGLEECRIDTSQRHPVGAINYFISFNNGDRMSWRGG